jgi:formylglycine-generating enzyme required for sulfatase activity
VESVEQHLARSLLHWLKGAADAGILCVKRTPALAFTGWIVRAIGSIERQKNAPAKNMVWIAGGTFITGSNEHYPKEAPAHLVEVDGFWID